VLHVPGEYDYRFSTKLKAELLEFFEKGYYDGASPTKPRLLKWEVPDTSLHEYTTQKADKRKGLSRMPPKEKAINYQAEGIREFLLANPVAEEEDYKLESEETKQRKEISRSSTRIYFSQNDGEILVSPE
jgi:hypothetical protein